MSLSLLLFLSVGLLLAADRADLVREEPPASEDAAEIAQLESEYVSLLKQIKLSPSDQELQKKIAKDKTGLFDKNYDFAKSLRSRGYLQASIGFFQRALLYHPDSSPARKALARAKGELNELNRKESDEFYQAGEEAYLNGDHNVAAEDWKRALELNSENADAQAGLEKINPSPTEHVPVAPDGSALPGPDQPEDKEALWDQNYRQGLEHKRMGEYEEAEQAFKTALEYFPGDEAAHEELDKVQKVLQKQRRKKSRDSYLLGLHAVRDMDYRSAYQYLTEAVKIDPSNHEARSLLDQLVQQHPELKNQ